MTIRFYKVNDKYGCFSNFSKHGFELDGKYWPTSEHYFQAQKFVGSIYEEEIRVVESPMDAANMGRDRDKPLRSDWEEVKDEVMKKAVLQKFQTHPDIREILISTSPEEIIEETTGDYYWGCGTKGTGKNVLGKILMEVRSTLESGE
ncbi:NADAR domain-containing protein [Paenibacillus sp. G2S3]|uniref:NADAR family protein n=1 Tax=Paenibacillus sp. G2S3 TaxID=3047872 RepID=UPI0024C0ED0E|nr:NADAR domain-containing protein [Paenibacillus sp. G2S3]WHY17932.1 NADAR domain-containing protein [Paenibacillus sp. G2S3]